MGVKLRKRATKDRYRFYLDIHEAGKRKSEFLDVYMYKRPKNPIEKGNNDESKRTAEAIRAKRELELGASDYDIHLSQRKRVNFFTYCEEFLKDYQKKDIRMLHASVKYLKEYSKTTVLQPKQITESFCEGFKDWLDRHENLSGDTPHDYFSKFKKIIKAATRDKLFSFNPATDVVNKVDKQKVAKDILTVAELQALAGAYCGNDTVKRAFLFACNTGLRFCDIVELKWKHINNGALSIEQQKTDRKVTINLNMSAVRLVGPSGAPENPVFIMPSHNAVLKLLRNWSAKAKLTKHVTFHVARHSFATNLLIYETDIRSVASLLGHSGLNHVTKYVRAVDELKQRAVDRLPEMDF
jgi:integrase/recombinase XerD